ncbi:hypothetical protein LCGC14_1183210 [marine sediment metagenome]|uniref:Uncharacterized protein n=1 Tax=marine sediment metagenome TaxID=412755 RepID=A0A0F9P4F4_9ZZZZ
MQEITEGMKNFSALSDGTTTLKETRQKIKDFASYAIEHHADELLTKAFTYIKTAIELLNELEKALDQKN